jgi:hypothetical protein
MRGKSIARSLVTAAAIAGGVFASTVVPAARSPQAKRAAPQTIDTEYTSKIQQYTEDRRTLTELVDHMPASDRVPSPLKVLGRIPGTPNELTYYDDILRYFHALDAASDRVKLFTIGKSDEGRDLVMAVVADEATIRSLDKYKAITAQLTDPRRLDQAPARQLIAAGKPIYHITGSMHSTESGSPEMLMELAFRLAVEETPFIQAIRNNVIVAITPVLEVDGRDKQVDTFYYGKKTGKPVPPPTYWGRYVAHDNNRDAIGQGLTLTQQMMRTFLDWHPTVLHDLHESMSYLYIWTGTSPLNRSIDPLTIEEWWLLAKHEESEMTKRGVPGVWTGGTTYGGWAPNFLIFIANLHNAIGRIYETQKYGPAPYDVTPSSAELSREWYRPTPPLPAIKWGPRNNVNIQESALLLGLNFVARNRETFLENYYVKNKRAIERGRTEAPFAWVIPAAQRRRGEAADLVNLLRRQGVEVQTANAPAAIGGVQVAAGDYLVRMDQPYRPVVDALLGVQYFPAANPIPFDDTGWSLPLLRNVEARPIDDKAVLHLPMTMMSADAAVTGVIRGTGPVLLVEHNTDNRLVTFRFAHPDVRMQAAEQPFEAAGRTFPAGTFILPDVSRDRVEASIKELGLSAHAVPAPPAVRTHDLDVPRIACVHSWLRAQDEGWVRLALDTFRVPYTYIGEDKLRSGDLKARYDVIILPHIGGTPQEQVNGIPLIGDPIPYRKSELTPHLGVLDSTDDVRGGMGIDGVANLARFLEAGGTLIVEGSTTTILPAYGVTTGVVVEEPPNLYVKGSVLKALLADKSSPILYGYDADALAVYFSQGPVLAIRWGGTAPTAPPQIPGVGQNPAPNDERSRLTTLAPRARSNEPPAAASSAEWVPKAVRVAGGSADMLPRVILRFPADPDDMLLSGVLVGAQALSGRAVVVDAPVGKGHVVMFANRPYWRWETQGSFFLGFNAILNWNHLDAGKRQASPPTSTSSK